MDIQGVGFRAQLTLKDLWQRTRGRGLTLNPKPLNPFLRDSGVRYVDQALGGRSLFKGPLTINPQALNPKP